MNIRVLKTSVSIIICTRNRAQSLRETLASFANVEVPASLDVELLTADNGSTDETADIARGAHLPRMALRVVDVPEIGQCQARNRGLAEAGGDVIVFTDDDVRPSPNWLAAMTQPIIDGTADVLGGDVKLAPHLSPPWLTRMHRGMLAECLDVDSTTIVGANMSFSRRVLRRVEGFDVELGPGALGLGDDTLFNKQLEQAGFRFRRAGAGSLIEHHFEESRLHRDAFLKSAERSGRSLAYIDYHWRRRRSEFSALRRFKSRLGLAIETLKARGSGHATLGEIHQRIQHGYHAQMSIEQLRQPNYQPNGLIKISGVRDPHLDRLRLAPTARPQCVGA